MEPERTEGQKDAPSANGHRRERAEEERRRRRSWIADEELARSLNAAIQDEDADED